MEEINTSTPTVIETRKTAVIPNSDLDLCAVAKSASAAWNGNSWLTLVYTSASEFANYVAEFDTLLDDRLLTGSTRPETTKKLEVINKKMERALIYVKGYLSEKYGKEVATSYYAAFGIKYKRKRYMFPEDQNKRSAALTLMVRGISTHGFNLKAYGTDFWTNIKNEYNVLLGLAVTSDGEVSDLVGDKNILKKKIKKTLISIIHSIKSNYPDTYKHKLRQWGFQKEKY